MQLLENFGNAIYSVIKGFGIFDLLDSIIISYIVYKAFKIVRETRAEQLLKGILLLCLAYLEAFFYTKGKRRFFLKLNMNTAEKAGKEP